MRSLLVALLLVGCTDTSTPVDTNEGELITTVELTLTPQAGGNDAVFVWTDRTDTGVPEADTIALTAGVTYDLAVRFLDELSDPAIDITEEIADESDEHQLFFTGNVIDESVVEVAYEDTDANGLPVGLSASVSGPAKGGGQLTVSLQHLPVEGDVVQKVAGLADTVASDGLGAIAGETDVSVEFDLEISAP